MIRKPLTIGVPQPLRSIAEVIRDKELELRRRLGSLQVSAFQKITVPRSVRQTAAAITFAYFLWFFVLFYVFSFVYAVFFANSFFPLVLHLIYYIYTRIASSEKQGGRGWRRLRESAFCRYFREYFPIEVRLKNPQTKFPGDRKFLFGYHPHGLSSIGAMGAFGPLHADVQQLLGGLEISGCTLDSNFRIPVVREFLLAMGGIGVSEESIKSALNRGRAVMVVLGGASEALYAKPLKHDVVVKKRYGFFRIALETGSSIVPVYSFGENELFDQVDGGFARLVNSWLVKNLGFFIPIYFGTGQTLFNPVPQRRAIITVVGEPIDVQRKSQPTSDDIERLKRLYIHGLEEIFDSFADLYSPRRLSDLKIVE